MQAVGFERVLKPRFGMGTADEAAVASKMKDTALRSAGRLPPRPGTA
jgi:hypothetical protein